jgi:putative endonuclease
VNWQVYIIRCSDLSLYTGITTDVERRWRQHAGGRGARYFRAREPVEVVYLEAGHDRGSASRREADIKKLRRVDKERLIRSARNQLYAGIGTEVEHVHKTINRNA